MRTLVGLLVLVLFHPAAGHAQLVRGAVRSDVDSAAVASASVRLITIEGEVSETAVTDTAGRFALAPERAGRYIIEVSHVGYSAVARPIELERGYELVVVLTMAQDAIALAPLVVTARRRVPLEINGFYRRSRGGAGRFLTRHDIERRRPIRTTDLLTVMPRVRLIDVGFTASETLAMRTPGGGYCAPAIYIDGLAGATAQDVNMLLPEEIDAVEVYSSAAMVPMEFQRHTGCGAIMFWMRQDLERPAFTWKRLFIGVGAFLGMLLLSR